MLNGPSFPPNKLASVKYFSWVLRLLAALILSQSLIYKFGGHPDSIMLFTQLEVEPFGRFALGILELLVVILLLFPKTTLLGAVAGFFIMTGALGAHIFKIGIIFNEDGGKLFGLALVCFLGCLGQVIIFKNQLINFIKGRYAI